MSPRIRIVIAAAFAFLIALPPLHAATCEGGYGVPQQWESTFRYYNASTTLVGYEVYTCDDIHIARGTLSGTWMEETDVDCCTGQTQHAYFYFCPNDGDWHEVSYVGETNCS
jgi:hypothetical protein